MSGLVFNPGTGTYVPSGSLKSGSTSGGGSSTQLSSNNTTSPPPEKQSTSTVSQVLQTQVSTVSEQPSNEAKKGEYKIYFLSGNVIGQPVSNFVVSGTEAEAIAKAKDIGMGARFEVVNTSTGEKKTFQPTYTTEQLKSIAEQTGTTFYQVRKGDTLSAGGILPKGYSEEEAGVYNPLFSAHLYDAYKMGNLPKDSSAYKFFESKSKESGVNSYIEAQNRVISDLVSKGYEPIFATSSGQIYYIKNPQDFKEKPEPQEKQASGKKLFELANNPYTTVGAAGVPSGSLISVDSTNFSNLQSKGVYYPETKRVETPGYTALSKLITFSKEVEKAPVYTYGEYKQDEPFTTTLQRSAYETTLFFVSPLWKVPTFLTAEWLALKGTPEEYSLAKKYLGEELPSTAIDVSLMFIGGTAVSFIKPPVLQATVVGATATGLSATIGGKDLKESLAYGLSFGLSVGALRMIHSGAVAEKIPKIEFKAMQQDITVSGSRFTNVIKAETKGIESVTLNLEARGFTFDTYSRYNVEGTKITKVFGIIPYKEHVKYEGFTRIEYPIRPNRMITGEVSENVPYKVYDKKIILTTGDISGSTGIQKSWFGFEPSSAKPIYPAKLKLGEIYLEKGDIRFVQNVKPVGSKSFVLGEFLSWQGNKFYRTGFDVRLKYDNVPRIEKPERIVKFSGVIRPELDLTKTVTAPIYDKPPARHFKGQVGIGVQETVVKQKQVSKSVTLVREASVQRVKTSEISKISTQGREGLDYRTMVDVRGIAIGRNMVGLGYSKKATQGAFEKAATIEKGAEKTRTPEIQIGKKDIIDTDLPVIDIGSTRIIIPNGGGGGGGSGGGNSNKIINTEITNINISTVHITDGGGRLLVPGIPLGSLFGGGGGGSGRGKIRTSFDLSASKYTPSLSAIGLGVRGKPSFAGGIGIRPIVSFGFTFGRKRKSVFIPGVSQKRIKTKTTKNKTKEKFGIFERWYDV